MSVASLIVRAAPSEGAKVAERISALENTQVTDLEGDAMVVLTDAPDIGSHHTVYETLCDTDGVINVNLVFHAMDEVED